MTTGSFENWAGNIADLGAIYADTPHGIETGAPVIYENNGLADIQNLTGGNTYYVSAIDPHHLRLGSFSPPKTL